MRVEGFRASRVRSGWSLQLNPKPETLEARQLDSGPKSEGRRDLSFRQVAATHDLDLRTSTASPGLQVV